MVGPHAVAFELSSPGSPRLWLEASRVAPGLYLLEKDAARARSDAGAEQSAPGRTRHALLLLRKHLAGARVTGLARIPGERTLRIDTSRGTLALRISGAPALSLAVDGAAAASFGEGAPAWPLPEPRPEREWEHAAAAALAEAAAASGARGVLAACPALGGPLASVLAAGDVSFETLRALLAAPRPHLVLPGPPEGCADADLAPRGAVELLPVALELPGRCLVQGGSWGETAGRLLELRLRGARFAQAQRGALTEARREARRLSQLEAHLARDLAGLASASDLRRQAEALLAFAAQVPRGAGSVSLPDPYDPARRLAIALEPALPPMANADRIFARARRLARAREQVLERLAEARSALAQAQQIEARAVAARTLGELEPAGAPRRRTVPGAADGGRREYLTSRGLTLLVGRGARENQELTFGVARPEDLWLHARQAPGAHVILRDPEGRAGAEDLREAAELAAFFSEARAEAQVDVHVTRRKHVRPARGGPGRVIVGHSETLRVTPRDPEGRLRRR